MQTAACHWVPTEKQTELGNFQYGPPANRGFLYTFSARVIVLSQ